MNWAIDKNLVKTPADNVVKFDFDIRESKAIDNVLVVVLEIPIGKAMTENVFCVSSEGVVLWQISRIPETSGTPVNRYMDILDYRPGHIRVGNWNGGIVDIKLTNGKATWLGWSR